jgi:AcrR family transcriptional regulator
VESARVALDSDGIAPDRLIEVAADLFYRKGYSGTTTRELAAALGIQKGSLYYYFERKEDLLYWICMGSLDRLQEAVQGALAREPDPLRRLEALVTTHVTTILADLALHASMLLELRALARPRRTQVIERRDAYEDLVREVIAEAQRSGHLRRDLDSRSLAFTLFNLMNWTITWFRPGATRGIAPDSFAALLVTIFLDGAGSGGGGGAGAGRTDLTVLPEGREQA